MKSIDLEEWFHRAKEMALGCYAKAVEYGPPLVRHFTGNYDPFDTCVCLGCLVLIFLAFGPRVFRRGRKRGRRDPVLDKKVFEWDRANTVTVRDLVGGGIHAFGGVGSGKTSSFWQIARAILKHGNTSMLFLCAKRGEYLEVLKLAKETGRSRDVILVDPQHGNFINLMGHEATRKGDGAGMPQNVTRFLMNQREVLLREASGGGGEQQFWRQQDERTICSAVTLLMMAREPITPANIIDLVLSAPLTQEEKTRATWKTGYCNRVMDEAHSHAKSKNQIHDYNACADYFLTEWPGLGERTRGSVLMGTMATLSPLNTGLARTMFGDTTTFSITDAIEKRKIVVVNMPPDEYGDLGRVANVGIKYLWQQEGLRRDVKRKSPISVVWGDENSQWITSFDTSFLSRCRSYRCGMVCITQSLASYRDVLPGARADASIQAFLAGFTTKVFFAISDHDTAQWAAKLVGQELRTRFGGSTTHKDYEPFAMFPDRPQVTSSFSHAFEDLCRPEVFMNSLRTGSPVNNYQVDALVVRFGGLFANGLPVIQATFDQRK